MKFFWIFIFLIFSPTWLVAAQERVPDEAQLYDGLSFDAYLQVLIARARAKGVSEETLTRMTEGLVPNDRVIRLDRGQPGRPTRRGYPDLAPYIRTHVNAARIRGGREVFNSNRAFLETIEDVYGVPGEIIIAIFGHETSYGRIRGSFDLAQSLSTLAWEGRRRELFSNEFIALMEIADKGFERNELVGSYAGAFGNPQFLPSVFLRLSRDGDGDGIANIFTNQKDTFASIANYLHHAGWRAGHPWGIKAEVPEGFNLEPFRSRLRAPVCPRVHERHSNWKTIEEWKQVGIKPIEEIDNDILAFIFQPDGPETPAWLLTSNYRTILEYNCSNYYAMSVGLLADEITR